MKRSQRKAAGCRPGPWVLRLVLLAALLCRPAGAAPDTSKGTAWADEERGERCKENPGLCPC